jgi:hypothetical protein
LFNRHAFGAGTVFVRHDKNRQSAQSIMSELITTIIVNDELEKFEKHEES